MELEKLISETDIGMMVDSYYRGKRLEKEKEERREGEITDYVKVVAVRAGVFIAALATAAGVLYAGAAGVERVLSMPKPRMEFAAKKMAGEACLLMDYDGKAEPLLDYVSHKAPDDIDTHRKLLGIYAKKGDAAAMIAEQEEIVRLLPDDADERAKLDEMQKIRGAATENAPVTANLPAQQDVPSPAYEAPAYEEPEQPKKQQTEQKPKNKQKKPGRSGGRSGQEEPRSSPSRQEQLPVHPITTGPPVADEPGQ